MDCYTSARLQKSEKFWSCRSSVCRADGVPFAVVTADVAVGRVRTRPPRNGARCSAFHVLECAVRRAELHDSMSSKRPRGLRTSYNTSTGARMPPYASRTQASSASLVAGCLVSECFPGALESS